MKNEFSFMKIFAFAYIIGSENSFFIVLKFQMANETFSKLAAIYDVSFYKV
jgi:hypothetical protein